MSARVVTVSTAPDGSPRVVIDEKVSGGPVSVADQEYGGAESTAQSQRGAAVRRLPGLGSTGKPFTGDEAEETSGAVSAVTRWVITELPSHAEIPSHTTPTFDHGLVLKGMVILRLETRDITLHAGDAVAILRAPHGWLAGPSGCTMSTVQVVL